MPRSPTGRVHPSAKSEVLPNEKRLALVDGVGGDEGAPVVAERSKTIAAEPGALGPSGSPVRPASLPPLDEGEAVSGMSETQSGRALDPTASGASKHSVLSAPTPTPSSIKRLTSSTSTTSKGEGEGMGERGQQPSLFKKANANIMATALEPTRWVLDPRHRRMARWDSFVAVLLLFTAIVTPFEVCFLEPEWRSALFWINRLVDLSFILDIVVNFHLSYYDPNVGASGTYITNLGKIKMRYLKGWFALDFLSVVPFDVLSIMLDLYAGASADTDSVARLRVVRLVRLLRLVKLLRIVRTGRVMQRIEEEMEIDYNMLTLIKFVVMVLSLAHWLACAWHMVAVVGGHHPNWVTNYFSNWMELPPCGDINLDYLEAGMDDCTFENDCCFAWDKDLGPFTKYAAALYWALVTITTIGYGDVVPANTGERIFLLFTMLLGTSVFAYVVGSVCGIVAAMDRQANAFHEKMDLLSDFMKLLKAPRGLRNKLKAYFRYKDGSTDINEWRSLLDEMSPDLRAEVAMVQCGTWLRKIHFFVGSPRDLVVQVASCLCKQTFPGGECVIMQGESAPGLYIVERGVIGGKGRVFLAGSFFGEEALASEHVRLKYVVRALTFSDVFLLQREVVAPVIARYPAVADRLRRFAVRSIARDAVTAFAKAIRLQRKGVLRSPEAQSLESSQMQTPGRAQLAQWHNRVWHLAMQADITVGGVASITKTKRALDLEERKAKGDVTLMLSALADTVEKLALSVDDLGERLVRIEDKVSAK